MTVTRAVVQARMSSTRLPGKSMADVGGEPMLALLLRRLSHARRLDEVWVATSVDSGDDPIAALAQSLGCRCHRGSLHDVLARYVGAADGADALVRITADCPLIDPEIVDRVVALFWERPGCRYASNVSPRTYPDGLDTEVVDPAALREVCRGSSDPAAHEHVTIAVRESPERYPARSLVNDDDLGDLRWTVDYEADLEFVRRVVERLGDRRYIAGMAEILAAVRSEPSLAEFEGVRG